MTERFDPAPILKTGYDALAAGDLADASRHFHAVLAQRPLNGAAWLGLAQVSLAEGNPAAALDLVARYEQRAPNLHPRRHLVRARAHGMLSDHAAAEAAWRELLRLEPTHLGAHFNLVGLLREAGRRDEAFAVIDAAVERMPDNPGIVGFHIASLVDRWRVEEAAARLDAAIDAADTPETLLRLHRNVARTHGRTARGAATFARMRDRLSCLPGSPDAAVLSALLHGAAGDWAAFAREADALLLAGHSGAMATELREMRACLRDAGMAGARRAKVFGIGLSKTGTTSLNTALRRLGYSAQHWSHPITGQMLCLDDAAHFDALTDLPIADLAPQLLSRYPDARFILTVRPFGDWQSSFERHHARDMGVDGFAALQDFIGQAGPGRFGGALRQLYARIYTCHDSLGHVWDHHMRLVERLFAHDPARLLRLDISAGDGWPQLCGFLDLPVPDEPFPHDNRTRT